MEKGNISPQDEKTLPLSNTEARKVKYSRKRESKKKKWKKREKTHSGLAKFMMGCNTKQVRNSRAKHRTRGHWASLGLSTVAMMPLVSR